MQLYGKLIATNCGFCINVLYIIQLTQFMASILKSSHRKLVNNFHKTVNKLKLGFAIKISHLLIISESCNAEDKL